MAEKTGVYICHCGENIAGTVEVEEVAKYAAGLDSVASAQHYMYMCSEPGQELIQKDIRENGIDRVVVASCSPRMHELTFRNACAKAGLNPYLYEQVNVREHCSWVHTDKEAATQKAKDLIRAGVSRVRLHEPLVVREAPVNPNTLVVGGGIAGMTAALKIAASGNKVYLVEKEASIGGHMAQLDVTFPTLDCSECTMTPRMTDVGSSPNIELFSCSQVEEVSGYVGNFKAKIKKKARYVDLKKCTSCGDCTKGCPVDIPNAFNEGMNTRKAIYRPFAQAIPNKFLIDKRETPPCKLTCPINMDVQGYLALIAVGKFQEAYQVMRRTNPLPAICGRVCYHPCETACKRGYVDDPLAIASLKRFLCDQVDIDKIEVPQIPKNGKKVAIIGSGPGGLAAANDLALLGYEPTIFEALPEAGGMLRVGIPEYRLPKDILAKDIAYIQKLGVDIKTGVKVGEQVKIEDLKRDYKAILVATGAHGSVKMGVPGEDSKAVITGVDFLREINLGKKVKVGAKVAVIGGGNTAIDAARVARRLGASVTLIYRRTRVEMPANAGEVKGAEDEGIELMFLANPVKIDAQQGKAAKIECIRMKLGEPDASGRPRPVPIKGSEFTIDVDTVITALGQTSHVNFAEALGLKTAKGNVVANDNLATNIEGVFAAGDVVTGPAMVVDAIAGGQKAAKSIDAYLKGETPAVEEKKAPQKLDEKEIAELKKEFPVHERVEMPEQASAERIKSFGEVELGYSIEQAQEEAKRCLACGGCCDCRECAKLCQAGAIDYDMPDETIEVEVGSIILSTGFDAFDPAPIKQYGYGQYENVLTALEFERMCSAGGPTGGEIRMKDGSTPESVAIVHCVGSRDKNYHEYCSRVCCMYGLKDAHLVRHKTDAQVYEFYIDMRCFGEGYEEFYKRLSEEGVKFVRGKVAKVTDEAITDEEKGKLVVVGDNTLLGGVMRTPVDMVILCQALEPRSDSEDIVRMFNISRRPDGFFQEKHLKLDPIATPTAGVFVIGCAGGPKDITDTVGQALGGAGEALAMISRGSVTLEAVVSHADESICIGCGRCEDVCEYHAPEIVLKDGRKMPVCVVNEALCKGCGSCAVVCPTGAMTTRHFTRDEIGAMVDALVEV
ncbi:MAG: NAD(P)-binding protein [Dehalococcoidia bacterium]|nr:NAD(P)-binding protein [Dehalococcoidia bacterium]